MLFINSIKHQSFVYTQLNDKTIIFQAIQSSQSHLFALFKCQTFLFDSHLWPYQELPFWTRVDLGAMGMLQPLLDPHHQFLVSIVGGIWAICRDPVDIFYSSSQWGQLYSVYLLIWVCFKIFNLIHFTLYFNIKNNDTALLFIKYWNIIKEFLVSFLRGYQLSRVI